MGSNGSTYRGQGAVELSATIAAEEAELDFDRFGMDEAWTLGTWLRDTAIERGHAVGFAVVLGDHRAFWSGTAGSSALNDAWLERKFRVVRHFTHASLAVKAQYESVEGGSFARDAALDTNVYAAAGGAFPIRVRGSLVGAVGVSGLEMHDDHALVVEALRAPRGTA